MGVHREDLSEAALLWSGFTGKPQTTVLRLVGFLAWPSLASYGA